MRKRKESKKEEQYNGHGTDRESGSCHQFQLKNLDRKLKRPLWDLEDEIVSSGFDQLLIAKYQSLIEQYRQGGYNVEAYEWRLARYQRGEIG